MRESIRSGVPGVTVPTTSDIVVQVVPTGADG
mgnify:FL=1